MKNRYFAVLAALLVGANSIFANVVTGEAAVPDNYYDAVDAKKGADNILNALNTIIDGHTVINYDGLEPYYQQTDFYNDTLWDMYSTCRFVAEDANKAQKAVCDGWNKEHVCCQSWLGSGPMVSDLYNVYPTDARVNNLRSNYPYGEVNGSNGYGISKDPDKHALGKLGNSKNSITGYSDKVFEPHDNYKGDFARTFMYMVARYRNNTINEGKGNVMFVSSKTNFTEYAKNMLMRWHRQDPVSQKEIDRNQAVYGIQKNRNPFIDYPDLAEYIWGNKVGEQIDLSSMTPTCEGQTPDPYIQTIKFGVTWMLGANVIRVDSVVANGSIAALPETPVSCSDYSNVFVGWTNHAISGVTQTAPELLMTQKHSVPAVTDDVTYYAVFAHAEEQQGEGEVTATTDLSGFKRGNKVTSVKAGAITITFSGGKNETTYYTEIRCYANCQIAFSGGQMSEIEFTAGDYDKENALTPSVGTMIDNVTWQGNTNSVTFTVGGDSGYRGIGGITVTYIDQTQMSVLSDYMTSCGGTTEVEGVQHTEDEIQTEARKFIKDGKLYIEANGIVYDIFGRIYE